MPTEPDYKSAYEALMRAVDEANHILYITQIITSVELALQRGQALEPDLLEHYRHLKSLQEKTGRT